MMKHIFEGKGVQVVLQRERLNDCLNVSFCDSSLRSWEGG